jgi:hypothetical protein
MVFDHQSNITDEGLHIDGASMSHSDCI